jgi:hypothetical protein
MKIKDIKQLIQEYLSTELQYDESIPAGMRRKEIESMLQEFAGQKHWYDEN